MRNENENPARRESGVCFAPVNTAPAGFLPLHAPHVFLFLLCLLCISPIIFSQNTTIQPVLTAQNATFGFDNYVRATLAAAALMAAIMALVYMAGIFFQSEDAKQLARTEILQTALSVIIVAFLLAILLGVDTGLRLTSAEIVSPCVGRTLPASITSATLLNQYAFCYAQGLNEMAIAQGDTTIRKSVTFAKKAYRMEGFQTDLWWLLYGGLTRRPDANLRLDSEIMGQEFTLLTSFMVSLQGQLAFLQYIVPALAPALLFLGVILRSLFFTRKLGGMMLAAGAGLLLVWPATYLLSWFTLQVAVFGPSVMGEEPGSTCPTSCKILPPAGYNISTANPDSWGSPPAGSPYATGAISAKQMASAGGSSIAPDIGDEAAWKLRGVQTCYPQYNYTEDKTTGTRTYTLPAGYSSSVPVQSSDKCPSECRFLPTPTDLNCDLAACDNIPIACKAIRAMNLSTSPLPNPPDNCNSCTSCPAFCRTILPQVKYANPANPAAGVVPTTNANSCSANPGNATLCPLYCRSYLHTDASNTISYSTPDCQAACQATLDNKKDAATSQPDCMLGIPAAMMECNTPNVCGPAMNLEAAIASGRTDLCPIECRVNFNSSGTEDRYKDPTFNQYCTGSGKFGTACDTQCPSTCKVKASAENAALPNSFSLGVPNSFIVSTGAGSVLCAAAPTFTNGQMDSSVNGQCARCPLSCRLRNPSSILDLDNNHSTYFFSQSHYALTCNYRNTTPIILYSGACRNSTFPPGWLAFASEDPSGISLSQIGRGPPECAPTARIYLRMDSSDPLCPLFLAPIPPYIKDGTLSNDPSNSAVSAIIPPNTDVSAECSTPDAQKYCLGKDPQGQPYCDISCQPDRAVNGPFYCHLTDLYSPLSSIPDNTQRCGACSSPAADNSKGPQCQVMLTSGSTLYLPKGCDPSCAPGSLDTATGIILNPDTDPKSRASCGGFCYPRLPIPSCSAYAPASTTNPNGRAFASCAACPTDCRYDYLTAAGIRRPNSQDNYCGWSFTAPTACFSITLERLRGSDIPSVNNTRYYSCTQTEAGQYHWVRTSSGVDNRSDSGCNAAWYPIGHFTNQTVANLACGPGTFSNTTSDVYSCTPVHKYPALDSLVTSSGGPSDYRECGDISVNGQNPNNNLCGARTFGGASVQLCKNDRAATDSCFAHFNALAVACLPITGVVNDYTDPANNPTKAEESCQNCPLFCRIDNGGQICSPWSAGGEPPKCDFPNQCDRRTAQGSGYCGIPSSAFKIGQGCANYTGGSGVGCPARCRVSLPSGNVPYGCSGGEIGNACSPGNLDSACTATPPDNPCAGCGECDTDCRSTPYVRQNCDDLCLPTDFATGASPITPKDLLMSWEGASGNPDWRSLGSLGIAAFLLPILNIILTLAFIRSLSPVLGGDIEIPGILKVL